MQPLFAILGRPDNLPVVLMIVGFAALLGRWWAVARRTDRLLAEGGEEVVARDLAGPPPEGGPTEDLPGGRLHTWPHLLRVELLGALALLAFLGVWSILVDAPLEQLADPGRTPNPAKAPWYFLGLQEMLVYFDPWIAGVVLPLTILFGLCAIPYLDPNPGAVGCYCWRPRRLALSLFLFGLCGLWLPLIVVGVFFRGPGWGWCWPWQPWDPTRSEHHATRDLPALLGLGTGGAATAAGAAVLVAWFALPQLLAHSARARRHPWYARLGPGRVATLVLLASAMVGLPIKIALRLLLDVKYVLASSWFNV